MVEKIEELFGVSGKVVAITGAAGVLYGVISKALAANGAKVALLDILGDKVAALAGEIKADLLVMGTHGRSGIEHLLIGSVAERVVRKAPCPVLTVKKPRNHDKGDDKKKTD